MKMKQISWQIRLVGIPFLLLIGVGIAIVGKPQDAFALSSYLTMAEMQYPTIKGTSLDSCSLCHTSVPSLNPYGADFGSHGHSFTAIENLDSDVDGFTNIIEINAHTLPGDPNSRPAASPTATPTNIPPSPTMTPTNTLVPATNTPTSVPSTNTPTSVPATNTPTSVPATNTPTSVPATKTPTSVPATNTPTLMPATNTPTSVPATNTPTSVPATNTPTPVPGTNTPTRVPATSTPIGTTNTPTPTVTPSSGKVEIYGSIIVLPNTPNLVGNWLIGNTIIRVTTQTRISSDDERRIRVGEFANVQGTRLPDGSILAERIRLGERGDDHEHENDPPRRSETEFSGFITYRPNNPYIRSDWLIERTVIRLTTETSIYPTDFSMIRVGMWATVKGTRLPDGSMSATSISVHAAR